MTRFAAIEAGGTKFRVAIAEDRTVIADTTIPTTVPGETVGASIEFIRAAGKVAAVTGAASGVGKAVAADSMAHVKTRKRLVVDEHPFTPTA